MKPKLYWKTPRPWKRGREMPMIFCSRFWTRRSKVPEVFSTWLNRLFSPKEKIGTSAALEGHRGREYRGTLRGRDGKVTQQDQQPELDMP